MKPDYHEIRVGATEELSLRVSVATLVSVLFDHPENGRSMLALERTATLREIEGGPEVRVSAKPFGGAVRIIDPQALKKLIGYFHYDSEQSRLESDFRIQIHPASWEKVKQICRQHLYEKEEAILDTSPQRELAEEFEDTLNVRITPEQYRLKLRGMILEDMPAETDNVRAAGLPTVRIYYVFEAWMEAPEIIRMILVNNRGYADKDLQKMAWEGALRGGRGRANAILTLELDELKRENESWATARHGRPIYIRGHQLEGSVLAILGEVDKPKCQRVIRQA
jgi:hypothetical protein